MAILSILKIGHPVLVQPADPVENIDEELVRLAADMIQTMHAAPGVGLAAPQVNVSRRLITVDLSIGENPEEIIVLINPAIIESEGEETEEEGCLSVPEVREKVTRPARVLVKGIDLAGKERLCEARNITARVFCHELDHLNGLLFIDHLSSLKKSLIKKRMKRKMEKGELV